MQGGEPGAGPHAEADGTPAGAAAGPAGEAMGVAFGFTFGLLDVEDEQAWRPLKGRYCLLCGDALTPLTSEAPYHSKGGLTGIRLSREGLAAEL